MSEMSETQLNLEEQLRTAKALADQRSEQLSKRSSAASAQSTFDISSPRTPQKVLAPSYLENLWALPRAATHLFAPSVTMQVTPVQTQALQPGDNAASRPMPSHPAPCGPWSDTGGSSKNASQAPTAAAAQPAAATGAQPSSQQQQTSRAIGDKKQNRQRWWTAR